MMNADAAMYRAKGNGRNTFQFYDQSMNATARHALNVENALRHAIERNELELHYQPIVDTASNAMVGVEALLRWRNLAHGWVSPPQVLEIARQAQLIIPIEDWVIRTACRAAAAWRDAGGKRLPVSINLSGTYLRRAELVPTFEGILDEFQLDPGLIEIEVAAATFNDNIELTVNLIRQLCDIGVSFAVDDFGAGYAPLLKLRHLPIRALKIDHAVVKHLTNDSGEKALCGAVIALAHGLQCMAVAKGVSAVPQLIRLRELGCDRYQGDLFCPPVTAEQISRLLKENLIVDA